MPSRIAIAVLLISFWASPALSQQTSDACGLHVNLSPIAPAGGDDTRAGSAPADEYFGLYQMSVLGIANTLRQSGEAIDDSSDRSALTTGPLACAVDSIRAWERAYPADPWIAKDLLTLEVVYLRAGASEARELAARTEVWLEHDYPLSNYVQPARLALGKVPDSERRDEAVASAPRERLPAFVPPPIALASAPVPRPVTLAASFPEMRPLSSPWDRFAPLASDRP